MLVTLMTDRWKPVDQRARKATLAPPGHSAQHNTSLATVKCDDFGASGATSAVDVRCVCRLRSPIDRRFSALRRRSEIWPSLIYGQASESDDNTVGQRLAAKSSNNFYNKQKLLDRFAIFWFFTTQRITIDSKWPKETQN